MTRVSCPLRTLLHAVYSHSITHTFGKTENVLKSESYRNPQIAWPFPFLQTGAQSHHPGEFVVCPEFKDFQGRKS